MTTIAMVGGMTRRPFDFRKLAAELVKELRKCESLGMISDVDERLLPRVVELVDLHDELQTMLLSDPLTGVGNRRRLDLFLEYATAEARRGQPLTVVMIDLDDLRAINDRDGHCRGDAVLQQVAQTLQRQARGCDLVARFGGDEFVLALQGDANVAAALLRRVRRELEHVISFSAGVAEFGRDLDTPIELIKAADRAMYLNKQDAPQPH